MSEKPINPLRRRMIEDMTVRYYVEKRLNDFIRHVRTFTAFLGRSIARGFVPPWRLSDAGHRARRSTARAGIRNPCMGPLSSRKQRCC